jgi:large subunit ribosomal protein L25
MTELKAQFREVLGKKVKGLRRTGTLPAVLYGHGIKSQAVAVDVKEFEEVLKETGETSILQLAVGGKKHNVLIHDLQYHPLSGKVEHVDFYEVKMDEKIKANVPFVFTGESMAVKNEGGVLVRALQEVEIEALPKDLPREISVDISSLVTFEDKIHVRDLKMGQGIKILADLDEVVALVSPPRSEKELEELKETAVPVATVEGVKVVGEEKKAAEAAEKQAEEAATQSKSN